MAQAISSDRALAVTRREPVASIISIAAVDRRARRRARPACAAGRGWHVVAGLGGYVSRSALIVAPPAPARPGPPLRPRQPGDPAARRTGLPDRRCVARGWLGGGLEVEPGRLIAVALSLDAVDGWLARRLGLASRFGARFDLEIDALLLLILALLVWQADRVGAWVLVIGLLRYAFVAAGLARGPGCATPLPPSRRRQTVCVRAGGHAAGVSVAARRQHPGQCLGRRGARGCVGVLRSRYHLSGAGPRAQRPPSVLDQRAD